MLLIYWNGKVGKGIADLCEYLGIEYDIMSYHDPLPDTSRYSQIIPSPGVPSHHPVYATGKVISELDFAYQYLPKWFQIISITGTDGKSTTSWIMYSILEKEYFGKKNVYLSGNFDIPFSATVLDILKKWEKRGIIVVEVSSFMAYGLRGMDQWGYTSDYSIFTNFKPDHLNWHSDLEEYHDAKMRLIENTRKKAIINQQVRDFGREHWFEKSFDNMRIFAQKSLSSWEIKDWTDGENIIISGRRKYRLSETHFSGIHNAMNILSVALVANEMRICSKRMRQYLSGIQWLPHRLEKIREKNEVIFVEDSKSTSAQSLEAALGSYGSEKNLLLIVWWSDKGDKFSYLAEKMENRVKAMICIGATKELFLQIAREKSISHLSTDSLREWVEWLYGQSKSGDVLMLSPGCASFGLFRDYLDRANQFREIVREL
jgi:UDP-N-acetylmuramoylalanine--D-glutamate ligase